MTQLIPFYFINQVTFTLTILVTFILTLYYCKPLFKAASSAYLPYKEYVEGSVCTLFMCASVFIACKVQHDNTSVYSVVIFIVSLSSITCLLLVAVSSKKRDTKILDILKYCFGNYKTIFWYLVVFKLVIFLIGYLLNLGIQVDNIDYSFFINIHMYTVCLFPALYIIHISKEILKAFTSKILEPGIICSGYKPYTREKLSFSLLKLNYTPFQLLALVTGFSIFQGYVNPIILEKTYLICSNLDVSLNSILRYYSLINSGYRIKTPYFSNYLWSSSLRAMIERGETSVVKAIFPSLRHNFNSYPFQVKSSIIIPMAIRAFHPNNNKAIMSGNRWGISIPDMAKLRFAYNNLPLQVKLKIISVVGELSSVSKHNMYAYYSFLTSEGKYQYIDSGLKKAYLLYNKDSFYSDTNLCITKKWEYNTLENKIKLNDTSPKKATEDLRNVNLDLLNPKSDNPFTYYQQLHLEEFRKYHSSLCVCSAIVSEREQSSNLPESNESMDIDAKAELLVNELMDLDSEADPESDETMAGDLEADYTVFSSSGAGGNPSNTSDPSGSSNTPGNGGGNNIPNLFHDDPGRRSRSSSSDLYDDEVGINDSERVRDIKFHRFMYDVALEKSRGNLTEPDFNRTEQNPYNWPRSDSWLAKRLSYEIEAELIWCHAMRKDMNQEEIRIKHPFTFSLDDLGINKNHPLRGSYNNILFPGLHRRHPTVKKGIVYSPDVKEDRLKAIRISR